MIAPPVQTDLHLTIGGKNLIGTIMDLLLTRTPGLKLSITNLIALPVQTDLHHMMGDENLVGTITVLLLTGLPELKLRSNMMPPVQTGLHLMIKDENLLGRMVDLVLTENLRLQVSKKRNINLQDTMTLVQTALILT